ncbi:hypothetical protein [Motiliproteus sp. SC1-56]|uniref:hypothetical protein n=1 Tax=Motiliproteus sp. SC1-56 TaxID=2799565 RepID=UPI001A8F0FDA|nr:hypothetical protein [Motiliproteus sp. SC1-56]
MRMASRFSRRRPFRRIWVLLLAWMLSLTAQAEPLLQQSRAAQNAALDLIHELYVTESSLLFPQTNLLVVMLTQGHKPQVLLERLELSIDETPVKTHRYSVGDIEKFMDRAYQVLYTTLIPPGFHLIQAQVYGMGRPGQPAMSTEFTIEKGSQPLFVELNIDAGQVGHKVWR